MQLRRLRITGFKSFVDASELLIEPGLTGVVGPNGCGKSNLLEALRWTMGESSARSLRGAGMDDVIFAGTATRPQRDFAEVSILLDDADGDEVEVVRRIERGAGSAYRINGRDVRAKDVALLFADAATGAHSPALVSQNRIGAVIAARPAERRAMLEEAAGIAGLHVRRRDAEQRLRGTEANLARLAEEIAAQDAQLAHLSRQARQAERYRMLSDRIRIGEGRMVYARWRDAAAASDAARTAAAMAEAHVAEQVTQQAQTAQRHEGAVAAVAEARGQAQAARDRSAAAGHRQERLAAERDAAERRIAELADTVRRLADDRSREGTLASDAARAIATLNAEAQSLDADLTKVQAALPTLDQRLNAAQSATRDAEVRYAEALADQAREDAEARIARATRDTAATQAERMRRDIVRLQGERATLGDTASLAADRGAVSNRQRTAARTVREAQDRAAQAERTEAGAAEARGAAQSAQATAAAQLAALDAEAASLARSQRRSGRDRVIDHVSAQPGYERALAAALGDDLEAGLDPADDRHWAGAVVAPGDPAAPERSVCLAEHVAAPDLLARRIGQIFVADADTGQRLAVGQRLVTLDGRLRRWDGFVARGDTTAAAAERLERANRLRVLAADRPMLAQALADAGARQTAAQAMIATARSEVAAAQRDRATAEETVRSALREGDRLDAAIERHANRKAELEARLIRGEADMAEAARDLLHAEHALSQLPDGAATRTVVEQARATAERAREETAKTQRDRDEADRTLVRDRARRQAIAGEVRGWRTRACDAATRIAELDRREGIAIADRKALEDRPGMLAATLASIEAELTELRAAAAEAEMVEREADRRLREDETALRAIAELLSQAREARAGAAARFEAQEGRRIEMGRVSGERFQCPPPLLPERIGFAKAEVGTPADEGAAHERLLGERERIGPVNLVAERERTDLAELRDANAQAHAELDEAVRRLRGSIGTLNREGRQRLLDAFRAVDTHFRRLFTTLFVGGEAHLAMIDSDDPLEAGLEIMAQPPGKRLQSLTLLSGGEQALTAVALVFALFLTNPAPICVLDEVDAPLDDANIDRFCDLLDAMTRETTTRYLIVTHNAATMARMHRLFGVTMVEQGVSRLVSVDLRAADRLLTNM